MKKHRCIDNIAWDIFNDWTENLSKNNIAPEAKPYLKALTEIISPDEMYGQDSAESIIIGFIMNAKSYKTEKSETYINELKEIVGWEDDWDEDFEE